MNDRIFNQIQKRTQNSFAIAPTAFRFPILTWAYKLSTGNLKSFPFKIIIPVAIIGGASIFVIFGILIVRLAGLLQYGF